MGQGLADTLYFVHQHGIVHHDIKPGNILSHLRGYSKSAILALPTATSEPSLSCAEMLLGEVDAGDVRVDVYALAITLLELLLNRNPFKGMSPVEALRAKIQHQFVPPDLDRWVQDLLSKATHPTPELRFQSMQEFREAIESKHVSYVFDRSRVQAHALAAKAEKLLARKHVTAAARCIHQALYACPDCVSALLRGRHHRLFHQPHCEAKQYFDQALSVEPQDQHSEGAWLALLEPATTPQRSRC